MLVSSEELSYLLQNILLFSDRRNESVTDALHPQGFIEILEERMQTLKELLKFLEGQGI